MPIPAEYEKAFPIISKKAVLPPVVCAYDPKLENLTRIYLMLNAWNVSDHEAIRKLSLVSPEMKCSLASQLASLDNFAKKSPAGLSKSVFAGGASSRHQFPPRQALRFFLPVSGWENELLLLKSQLKPLGYDAFAGEEIEELLLFRTEKEAANFASGVAKAAPQVKPDGPAEIILDKKVKILSLKGSVDKKDYPPEFKKMVEPVFGSFDFARKIARSLGIRHRLTEFDPEQLPGPRFQFKNYAVNWLPPQATFEYPTDDTFKISIPARYVVRYKVRRAVAVKDIDQYGYLNDLGLPASVGPSCDLLSVLRGWDKRYGITVLGADSDSVTLKMSKIPENISKFDDEIRATGSLDIGDNIEAVKQLKEKGLFSLWWER